MSGPLKALVALDDAVDRQVVETLLTSSQRLTVVNYGELDSADLLGDRADVLVVACADYTEAVANYLEDAANHRAGRPLVLFAPISENGFVADAFRRGVDDIVTLPVEADDISAVAALAPDVVFVLEKAVARRRGVPLASSRELGEMVCILGLKGGSGKTLTAANLSAALADAGKRVTLVDLDLQFGDLGLALGLAPNHTLYDLARSGGTLDAEKMTDFMASHPSGVRALLAPVRPDHAGVVTPEFLREVFELLREMSDFVIVDTPPGFTPEVIAAVDSSTSVCMVAALDSLSLKNTKLGLETLELMDYDAKNVRVLLNRADSKVGISNEDVLAILGQPPAILVPSDRNVTRSVNEGDPIALSDRRSDAARSFHALASLYIGADTSTVSRPTKRRRRLLPRR
jgi:pilus assembly protein CpaE